eukprot:7168263-Pyramimonas_sp.AAC.2
MNIRTFQHKRRLSASKGSKLDRRLLGWGSQRSTSPVGSKRRPGETMLIPSRGSAVYRDS